MNIYPSSPMANNQPLWLPRYLHENIGQINFNPYPKLGTVVSNIGNNYHTHFHFSTPPKSESWAYRLSDLIKCLRMFDTCLHPLLTNDFDKYKITAERGMLTKIDTVRFNYIPHKYEIRITLSDSLVRVVPIEYFRQRFIDVFKEMDRSLPKGRTKEVLEILVKYSQS